MKKILMVGTIIVGLIMANSSAALAFGKDKSQCPYAAKDYQSKISMLKNKVKPLWKHKDELGINEEQLTKIKDIKHVAIKEMIQLNADKDIVMVDLKSAMWKESIDIAAVNKLIDAKYQSKSKAAKLYVKAISDIQNILSEEQRTQWRSMSTKYKSSRTYCAKCDTYTTDKICPLTGNSLSGKGSSKGSMNK